METLALIVDVGDRCVYEERLVSSEVAEAINRGERMVDLSRYNLAIRYEIPEALEHLAIGREASKDRMAALRARLDQIEAANPELREERRKNEE